MSFGSWGQIGYGKPARPGDDARVAVRQTTHGAHERGLARAIHADQTHMVTALDLRGNVLEKILAAELQGKVVDAEHRETGKGKDETKGVPRCGEAKCAGNVQDAGRSNKGEKEVPTRIPVFWPSSGREFRFL